MKLSDITRVTHDDKISVGTTVLREIDDDDLRLQFQVRNESSEGLKDLECWISY